MPRTRIDIESRFTLKVLVVLSKDYQGSLSRRLDTPLTGGDFWKGAVTGATIGYLNHAIHQAVAGEEDETTTQTVEDTENVDQNGGNDDGPPEGYRYAPHEQVNEIMGTSQIEKDWLVSAGISTLGAFVEGTGKGSWGAGILYAVSTYFKAKYYENMYIHYSEHGNMEGVYYRNRFVISGDRMSWYRDIIYVNKQGHWIIQP